MYKIVNIYEAKTHLSKLITEVIGGAEIFITKAGKPVAKIVSLKEEKTKIKFGIMKGKINLSKDFDEPLLQEVINLFL